MLFSKKTGMSILFLAVIGSIFYFSGIKQSSQSIIKTSHNNLAQRPDAIMEGVTATIINQQGEASLTIQTPKMVHYAKNDTTHIDTPHLIFYRHSPEPWDIRAKHAQATAGLNQIFFWDHVVIHHSNDRAHPTATLTTASLTVWPNQQIAKTNDPVTLIEPDTRVEGRGMLANLESNTVQLLSQARGEYAPNVS